ncbi:hypothetical protein OS493_038126 [Desmophyllum pertusum]|uniref:Uncharacterized protein n=1 Tax=Desmophyllum pertusum TaxID=174260 RepID=A0A9X0CUD4_9CNID|nr:hypothetical protein OS493_038126 [Desmophyllum pertusum]
MAEVRIETHPGLQQLFREISAKFDPTETENVVQSMKRNYGGKFNLLDDQDLLSCLLLLEKHGHVSDNKLTLIEQFVVPKSNKESQESIKETIESFKRLVRHKLAQRRNYKGDTMTSRKLRKARNRTDGFELVWVGWISCYLRQERKSADDLITGVHKGEAVTPKKSKLEEDAKEEGVDIGQLSAIREMFDTLPTDRLKMSAVSISLFCGPFSVFTAAKVLGICQSEALAQLEGLVTSAIIFVVYEEAKERMYDIHPLLRKYANSIKMMQNS